MSVQLLKKVTPGGTWFGASQTVATDNSAEAMLGQEIIRSNKASRSSKALRNGKPTWMRFVKNSSGINLLPGMAVAWKASEIGTGIGGYQRTSGEAIAGIVDDWLPSAGVRTGDYFYVIIEGEALGKMALSQDADIAQGDIVWCGLTQANSTGNTTTGRITKAPTTFTATQTTDGTLWLAARNSFARALSAVSSSSTGQNILIEVTRRLK